MKKTVDQAQIGKQYQTWPSLADLLPWLEFSDDENIVLLEDRASVGALLEISDISCEAAPEMVIQELHQKLTALLSTVLPLCDENPWVLQFYVQDELSLDSLLANLKNYIQKRNPENKAFVDKYIEVQEAHFKHLCSETGVFKDPMSGLTFQGKQRRIRVCLYRRYSTVSKEETTNKVDELKLAINRMIARLEQMGIACKQLSGRAFYEWLVRWLNPSPKIKDGNVNDLLDTFPYPQPKPFGWSLCSNTILGTPESFDEGWIFDGIKHKLLTFKDLQNPINIGVISRERRFGSGQQQYALFDKLPLGSIYTLQIVFESKKKVLAHLDKLEKAAVGKGQVIKDILTNINRARYEINENNNMLFRSVEGIYIRQSSTESLETIENNLQSLLNDSGLLLYSSKDELFPVDSYLRLLPFNFNPMFDRQYGFRTNYKYADDIARLLPVYGRSKGDGQNPLFIYHNRAGEPFIFDLLNKSFKMSNSHCAIIGTTGAGKSVLLNTQILSLSAVYNPHIIAIEVGGSFDLTANYLRAHGQNVGVLKFERTRPFSINPYAEAFDALKIIEQEEREAMQAPVRLQDEIEQASSDSTAAEQVIPEDRDILNEMLLATRIMITRGDPREEDAINLTDMTLINRALIATMKHCRDQCKSNMLVADVAEMFYELANEESNSSLQARLKEFGMRLEYYTQDIIRGKFINHPSEPLKEYDFLQIDFGFMQSESYQDLLNVVCISILSKILALAEANKASGRPTCLIFDEIHVFLKCPMIAVFVILMSKVARKLGLWITVCTQNINDFSNPESKKVLSMMETWICLALDKQEVNLLESFRPLSDEVRALLLDVRKYPGLYSEGVLLGKRYTGLFRNVPPRIALALAMTEQDERAHREQVQREHNISELEAIELIAKQLEANGTI